MDIRIIRGNQLNMGGCFLNKGNIILRANTRPAGRYLRMLRAGVIKPAYVPVILRLKPFYGNADARIGVHGWLEFEVLVWDVATNLYRARLVVQKRLDKGH